MRTWCLIYQELFIAYFKKSCLHTKLTSFQHNHLRQVTQQNKPQNARWCCCLPTFPEGVFQHSQRNDRPVEQEQRHLSGLHTEKSNDEPIPRSFAHFIDFSADDSVSLCKRLDANTGFVSVL